MATIIEQIQAADLHKQKLLSQLHLELGYDSPLALMSAIAASIGERLEYDSRVARKTANPKPATRTEARPVDGQKRKGRRVPQETLDQIAADLKSGATAAHMPAKYGVSYNIVHAVKRSIGMTQPRGSKRTSKAKRAKGAK